MASLFPRTASCISARYRIFTDPMVRPIKCFLVFSRSVFVAWMSADLGATSWTLISPEKSIAAKLSATIPNSFWSLIVAALKPLPFSAGTNVYPAPQRTMKSPSQLITWSYSGSLPARQILRGTFATLELNQIRWYSSKIFFNIHLSSGICQRFQRLFMVDLNSGIFQNSKRRLVNSPHFIIVQDFNPHMHLLRP